MDPTTDSASPSTSRWQFLGESPAAWAVFIVLLSIFLWLWGSVLHYLSGEA